jgi:hypothetical protein
VPREIYASYSFISAAKILFPNCIWHCGVDLVGWQAPRSAATDKEQALENAAKFTTPPAHLITD